VIHGDIFGAQNIRPTVRKNLIELAPCGSPAKCAALMALLSTLRVARRDDHIAVLLKEQFQLIELRGCGRVVGVGANKLRLMKFIFTLPTDAGERAERLPPAPSVWKALICRAADHKT